MEKSLARDPLMSVFLRGSFPTSARLKHILAATSSAPKEPSALRRPFLRRLKVKQYARAHAKVGGPWRVSLHLIDSPRVIIAEKRMPSRPPPSSNFGSTPTKSYISETVVQPG